MGKTIIITLILALVFGGGWYAGIGAWISNATGDVVDGISDAVGGSDGCETRECRDLVAVIREYGSKDQPCHAGLIPRMFVSEPIWSKLTRAGEAWSSEWAQRTFDSTISDADYHEQLAAENEYIDAQRDEINAACRAYWEER